MKEPALTRILAGRLEVVVQHRANPLDLEEAAGVSYARQRKKEKKKTIGQKLELKMHGVSLLGGGNTHTFDMLAAVDEKLRTFRFCEAEEQGNGARNADAEAEKRREGREKAAREAEASRAELWRGRRGRRTLVGSGAVMVNIAAVGGCSSKCGGFLCVVSVLSAFSHHVWCPPIAARCAPSFSSCKALCDPSCVC